MSLKRPWPAASARFDLNVAVGYFATSKKFADFKSLSRLVTPVLICETSIEMSAFRLATDVPSYSMVPLIGPSVPRTVDTIMCLTLNPAFECAVSTVHVFGPAGAWAGVCAKTGIAMAAAAARVRTALCMIGFSSIGSIRLAQTQRGSLAPGAQVDHLDEDREAHRKVNVALRNVLIEAFEQQREPDQQQEAERQHLHRR